MSLLKYIWIELILMLAVFASLLIFLKMRQGKQAQGRDEETKARLKWLTLYALRLVGFGLAAILLVSLAITVYRTWVIYKSDSAPAPSQVNIPEDLPFEVEEVTFKSEDGLQIAGWFIPSKNGATIILLHGYGGNRLGMRWHAERLVEAGYGVLMYDERASGESEGTYRSYGWEDPRDVGGALAFLNGMPEATPEKVGIAGCSIGGQIALQGGAYYPQIGAVWADGPSTIRAQDAPRPTNPIYALSVASLYMLDWLFEISLNIEAPAPMLTIIDDIAPRPIMLIGGGQPMPFVGSEGIRIRTYLDHAGVNAELWVIPEAYHCDGPLVRPQEYATRLVDFFNAAFQVKARK